MHIKINICLYGWSDYLCGKRIIMIIDRVCPACKDSIKCHGDIGMDVYFNCPSCDAKLACKHTSLTSDTGKVVDYMFLVTNPFVSSVKLYDLNEGCEVDNLPRTINGSMYNNLPQHLKGCYSLAII